MVGGIQWVLDMIPWWILFIGVFIGGWRLSGKLRNGLFMSLCVAIIILLDMINVEEKQRFLEGKSNFIDRVMIETECYRKYVLRFFGGE
mgnify:CR=1 FL=1